MLTFVGTNFTLEFNVVEIKFIVRTSIISALYGTEQRFYMGTSKKGGGQDVRSGHVQVTLQRTMTTEGNCA